MRRLMAPAAWFAAITLAPGPLPAQERGPAWARHTIDASSRGADGVRLADVNRDGLPDIATGWEEGGRVRVCLHPGYRAANGPWPGVTVGSVGSPEDAVLVDLDGDGATDVVSCCEGKTRGVFVHWAPREPERYREPAAWKTEPVPAVPGRMWMFCLPLQVDGRRGVDLIVGSKGAKAQIGWLEAPESPRDLKAWRWHPLCEAGWVMSLIDVDLDADGDRDLVASDRKGPARGCFWLENPGAAAAEARWARHSIGAEDVEVMFVKVVDLDRDGRLDVLAAARERGLRYLRRAGRSTDAWESLSIDLPPRTGVAKAISAGDIDLDGRLDLVVTFEEAAEGSGVVWLSGRGDATGRAWDAHEVSGPEGIKYDLVELVDLDGDGDLDALTCEERDNLGVVWYENPVRKPGR